MFRALSILVTRHAKAVVALWFVLIALGSGWALTGFGGQGLFDRLAAGDLPTIPGTESQEGRDILAERDATGAGVMGVVSDVDLEDPSVAGAAGIDTGTLMQDLMEIDGVEAVVSPYVFPQGPADPQAATLVAEGRDGFLVVTTLDADLDADAQRAAHDAVESRLAAETFAETSAAQDGVTPEVAVSSEALITDAILHQVQEDLVTGEALSLPLALVIMVIVFGGFLAAALPLVGALASIAVGMAVLLAATYVMDIESFVMTVVTVLGLGLSIDYGLLIVSRFREEVRATREAMDANGGLLPGDLLPRARGRHAAAPADRAMTERDIAQHAVRMAVLTAGRTVVFSALTVAISVAGLLLLRPDILRSISLGGVTIVLLAVAASVTLVPALMTLVGPWLIRRPLLARVPGVRRILEILGDVPPEDGVFSRLARFVHARPWTVLLGVVAILAVLALPLRDMDLRSSGVEMLPPSTELRQTYDGMLEDYPTSVYADATVLLATDDPAQAQPLVDEVAALENVEDARLTEVGDDGYSTMEVFVEGTDPGSDAVTTVVEQIRDLDPGFATWTMGAAAGQLDFTQSLVEGLPWAGGVVVVATFVLLFLMTGSVLIPLKALLMNVVSLAAALGATTWIFEGGHLEWAGVETVGGLETYVVAVIVAFGFGLAMDYEVFLLSRIKEAWDAGRDNDAAVEFGLQRSGRIITSAALIIIAVFFGFAFGELTVIKEVGVGLAITVLIDATLVRMLLVPATMTLLGRWNWWAPRWMDAIYRRFAIEH